MKRVLLALALLGFGAGMACADINDLRNGVFIAHHDPSMVFSEPLEGWCAYYLNGFAITSCDQQNPTIIGSSMTAPRMWYVLAQWWDGPKTWCATEFGFGGYDPYLFTFGAMYGPCAPGGFLEIPTDGWPGPNQGTVVATTDLAWNGNFVPVYYFTGYEYYGPGQIPFGVDPPTGFAGFVNCLTPPTPFDAVCLPAMGIGMPGLPCCSEQPQEEYPCCIGEVCRILTASDCIAQGGVVHTEWADCSGDPCVVRACCVGEICYEVNQQTCADMGGEFLPTVLECTETTCAAPVWACCTDCQICTMLTEAQCRDIQGQWLQGVECEPENPCEPSPTDNTSWGSIKAIYR